MEFESSVEKTEHVSRFTFIRPMGILLVFGLSIGALNRSVQSNEPDLSKLIATVKKIGPKGEGHVQAIAAMKELSKLDASAVPALLKGMEGANRLAVNWLRGAIEAAADKGKLPASDVRNFLKNQSNSQPARRLAFELLTGSDSNLKNRMLEGMLDDPNLEIRRDAVQLELSKIKKASSKETRVKGYQKALEHAREIAQIKSIAEALAELESPVDLNNHLGMLLEWNLIGPFENKEQAKFDEVYPPEQEIDLKKSYKGMEDAKFGWIKHTSSEKEGVVDLTKALGKHKGAIAYAYAEVDAPADRNVDVRLGCINANKVWVNGKLVISNNVYHAGMSLDQYIGKAQLKKGKNRILIKICQNEQTESWAQRWQFQVRLTDDSGKSIQ